MADWRASAREPGGLGAPSPGARRDRDVVGPEPIVPGRRTVTELAASSAPEQPDPAGPRQDAVAPVVLHELPDPVIASDSGGRIVLANRAAEQWLGFGPGGLAGLWRMEVLPELSPAEPVLDGATRARRRDGSELPVRATVVPAGEGVGAVEAVVLRRSDDVRPAGGARALRPDEAAAIEAALDVIDQPTLMAGLSSLVRSQGSGPRVAVLFVEIDDFRTVRARKGQVLYSKLLIEFARRLRDFVPEDGTLARVLVGRFALLLPRAELPIHVLGEARAIVAACQSGFPNELVDVTLAVNVGGTVGEVGSVSPRQLLHRAGQALETARHRNDEHVEVLDEVQTGAVDRDEELARAISRAAEDGTLEAHFQPIVELETGLISGFESFVRWHHEGRLLSPAEFLPLAEQTGAVLDIDAWMLRQSCAAIKRFAEHAERELFVSVNLSARHLESSTRPVEMVARTLRRAGLSPETLVLEIAEAARLADAEAATAALASLRQLGCRIALDDFGTGSASLNLMAELSAWMVKIDRSFTRGIVQHGGAALAVITGLVHAASITGTTVVAEGVETPSMARELAALGIRYGQGYLYGRPMTLAEVLDTVG